MHGGGHVGGGHVGGGQVPAGHAPGGHAPGGVPGPHHQHHHGPSDPAGTSLPGVAPISARGWLRRSDTPMSLHIVRAAVLLAVIGVLLWIGLH
jgi:hypothetical protein